MTRASAARVRRRRGRPDESADPAQQFKIAFATALQLAWKVNQREAFDLVVMLFEGEPVEPTPPFNASFVWPTTMVSFAGRTSTLKKRYKRSPPDEIAVLAALALRCKDLPAALRLFRSLLIMARIRGPEAAVQAMQQLLAS
jgi:hypothetical protein